MFWLFSIQWAKQRCQAVFSFNEKESKSTQGSIFVRNFVSLSRFFISIIFIIFHSGCFFFYLKMKNGKEWLLKCIEVDSYGALHKFDFMWKKKL